MVFPISILSNTLAVLTSRTPVAYSWHSISGAIWTLRSLKELCRDAAGFIKTTAATQAFKECYHRQAFIFPNSLKSPWNPQSETGHHCYREREAKAERGQVTGPTSQSWSSMNIHAEATALGTTRSTPENPHLTDSIALPPNCVLNIVLLFPTSSFSSSPKLLTRACSHSFTFRFLLRWCHHDMSDVAGWSYYVLPPSGSNCSSFMAWLSPVEYAPPDSWY